ncbi:low temperature requirement protein A [Micromonospora sp. NPDC005197]|uniref:low temperature requirement protein A n=1 Tax=Micromonospora sp. NPDC005197 TaxID=3157020 RepID=UPI0033BD56B4
MTTGGTGALVRRLDGSTRATLLELLFDVVFVAALAQTSKLLADQESWARSAAVLLMLTAIGHVLVPHHGNQETTRGLQPRGPAG